MAVVSISISVPNIAEVMALYDSILLYRSSNGVDGTYVQITSPSDALPLVPGVTSYQFNDDAGDNSFFYKSTYYSTVTQLSSPYSAPFGGQDDPALAILSVQQLKDRYLLGIDLTDAQGVPYPDSFFIGYIRSAVAWVSSMLDMVLTTTPVINERKDYRQLEVNQFFWTNLSKRPVQSVQAMRLRLPGSTPVLFPADWLEVQTSTGVVEVVPQSTLTVQQPYATYGATFYQYFLQATRRRIPNAIEIDYTAGYPPGQVPYDILEVIGKQAAIGPLRTAGNLLLGAGVASQSIGIDGLSQGVSLTKQGNGAFAAMVSDYQNDIAQQSAILKSRYNGVTLRIA